MDFKANIETRESVEAKAKAAFGFDLSSALDLVKRGDYDSDEAYLDACTRAELERSSPEYRAARSRLKVEYQARREEQERKAQSENYKAIRSSVSLDSVDKHNIDEEAAALARRDLSANRIAASDLGATIEKYAAELTERCSRRNRQHEIIYQTANVLSLSTFKKNSAAAHEKERIIYTMSEFNIYARKLDTAFKEARSEYNTAFRALQEAQQASRDANAWKPGDSAEEKQVRTTRAALKLHDAEATFNEVSARVWDNFKATRRTIRAELEQAVRAANIANPDAIDNNALELMKTGVLSPADYSAFMERFDSNPTMLKLVGHYAAEAAKTTDSRREAAALNAIALDCQSGEGAVMRAWDSISAISDSCGDGDGYRRKSPGVIVSMSEKWDDLAGEAVENF